MPTICPTITVDREDEFSAQLTQAKLLSTRIHIDLSDGTLAPRKLLAIQKVSWPLPLSVDLHIMSNEPESYMSYLNALNPSLVIVHAEARGSFSLIATQLHDMNIKVGVALLSQTPASILEPVLTIIDHVLIFSGNLGYQGGSIAKLELLSKVKWLKQTKATLEIGWDGGINEENINDIFAGGVDVLNVGGYLQQSTQPKLAYAKLKEAIKTKNAP